MTGTLDALLLSSVFSRDSSTSSVERREETAKRRGGDERSGWDGGVETEGGEGEGEGGDGRGQTDIPLPLAAMKVTLPPSLPPTR